MALRKLLKNCDTSGDVAAKLEGLGITGVIGSRRQCPIVKYIRQETGIVAYVDRWQIYGDGFSIDVNIAPTGVAYTILRSFINDFDDRRYPNLISVDSTGREEREPQDV